MILSHLQILLNNNTVKITREAHFYFLLKAISKPFFFLLAYFDNRLWFPDETSVATLRWGGSKHISKTFLFPFTIKIKNRHGAGF